MENTIKRNKANARQIESWLLSQVSIIGGRNVAKAIGVDESQVSRWKVSWFPKISMLLAVLEWGVVDDDIARLAKEVAAVLTKQKSPGGNRAIRADIKRWAPPNENNTQAYINSVAQATGVTPEQRIDTSDSRFMMKLLQAIIKHENGSQPYSFDTFVRAVDLAG